MTECKNELKEYLKNAGKSTTGNKDQLVKNIFKTADEKLNFPLSKLILEGPEKELQLTKNTQPSILTVSYSIFRVLKDEFGFDFRTFKYTFCHFQFKEFLEIYNRTTERCFRDCIVDLSRRDLTTEEDKCLDDCTTKLTKLNHRLLGTFMVEQPRFTQKKYV